MNRAHLWSTIGKLKNGETVYLSREGILGVLNEDTVNIYYLIEKDHRHLLHPLVGMFFHPSPKEKEEIYQTWPELAKEEKP